MTTIGTSAKEHKEHGTEKDWRAHVRKAEGKEGGRDSVQDTPRRNGGRVLQGHCTEESLEYLSFPPGLPLPSSKRELLAADRL